jgi:hypothetical protein
MRKSHTRNGLRSLRAGVAVAATAAAVVTATATTALAATTNVTLTPSTPTVPVAGGWRVSFTGGAVSDNVTMDEGWFISGTAACPSAIPTSESTTTLAGTGFDATDQANDVVSVITPALTAGSWRFCTYDTADVLAGNAQLTAVVFGKLSTYWGTLAGGNSITLTAPGAPFTGTVATTFNSATTTCPTVYGTAGTTNIATTTTKTSTSVLTIPVPKTLAAAGTPYGVCVFTGTTATSPLFARGDMTYAGYTVADLVNVTTSPTGGAEKTGNITLSTTTANTFTVAPGVRFTRGSCPTTYGSSTVDPYPATVTKISATKVAVTVPATTAVNGADATTAWHICTYASNSSSAALTAQPVTYNVAPVLDLSNVTSADFSPASGPAQGGTYVTISDLRGIPTAAGASVTASLGDSPMTEIKVNNSQSISGYVSAHAPGLVDLKVTTAAGTQAKADVFEYAYGITVTPNTAAPAAAAADGTSVVLDVMGAGFSDPSLTWAAAGSTDITASTTANVNSTVRRVLLTDNTWNNQPDLIDPTGAGAGISAFAAAPNLPIAQCRNVLVISDSELICTLDLDQILDLTGSDVTLDNTQAVPPGTYTVSVIDTAAATTLEFVEYNVSVPSSGSTFTVADF